jgi:hypothetical protein
MKSMIMLLTLSFYSTATLAAQADDQNIYHLQFKDSHLNAISNTKPFPAPAFDEEPHYIKLIAPVDNERDLKTFEAGLTINGYSKMIT